MTNPTCGLHHLGLTVREVDAASAFFVEALGFEVVGEVPDYPARFISDGEIMLTLWQAQSENPTPFDRTRHLGLHHFALRIADDATLSRLHDRLRLRSDVETEFAPEPLGDGPARHGMYTIPGGLRLELIALPS